MPLESIENMMRHARQHGYAVGYFESWNLESLHHAPDRCIQDTRQDASHTRVAAGIACLQAARSGREASIRNARPFHILAIAGRIAQCSGDPGGVQQEDR